MSNPEIPILVMAERDRQDNKWGEQNHGDGIWALILMEELGEAAKEFLEGNLKYARKELIESAAVTVAWVEAIDRRGVLRNEKRTTDSQGS